MKEERKYEWVGNKILVSDILDLLSIDSEREMNFKLWCFDHKKYRNTVLPCSSWANPLDILDTPELIKFALQWGLIQEIEETFTIGDVIIIHTTSGNPYIYIINSSWYSCICLNDASGRRWTNPTRVQDDSCITKKELQNHLGASVLSFTKLGHGAHYLDVP